VHHRNINPRADITESMSNAMQEYHPCHPNTNFIFPNGFLDFDLGLSKIRN
jgi:hypothetical protein